MEYKYTKENLCELFSACVDYAIYAIGEEKTAYLKELAKCDEWVTFVNSGIFHDAIGKVVEWNNESVSVVTEY